MKTWVFNRRTVEDQKIYIKADTLEEAWLRAREDDCDDTSDVAIQKTTLRHLPSEDY